MGNNLTTKKALSQNAKQQISHFKRIVDSFETYEQVQQGLQEAGLESSQLVIGVDFTKSNEWTGKNSFGGNCLHTIKNDMMNPYEEAMTYIAKTLSKFDDDNLIPCYGFGDMTTHDYGIFPFFHNNQPANGLESALYRYRQIAPHVQLSGPTSFAPIIRQAMRLVAENNYEYHILLIIADGQITPNCVDDTVNAIVDASQFPLSIIVVGVGDGPWDKMEEFDDDLPQRKFDNFQFVDFNKVIGQASVYKNFEERGAHFAVHALMEIPEQFLYIQKYITKKNIRLMDRMDKLVYDVPPTVQQADVMTMQFQ